MWLSTRGALMIKRTPDGVAQVNVSLMKGIP
jgi:hypothetical protein